MAYRIEFTPRAAREIKKLPQQFQEALRGAIYGLETNPRPHGVEKMKGFDWYKLRVGDYRVVYDIQDKVLLIVVIRVGDRKEVYRRL